MPASDPLIARGRRVLATEAEAVAALAAPPGRAIRRGLCRLILRCEGRVVVTGMGKSGHVGSKIAATLASTGTPSFFLHPAEASHGDIGMITARDVVLALSNSGETDELLTILPLHQAAGRAAGRADRQPGLDAGALCDASRSTSASRRRPARSTSRPPPAPPRRSRWATRSRSRCSRRAASPRRTSPARTRAAASAGACCCTSTK